MNKEPLCYPERNVHLILFTCDFSYKIVNEGHYSCRRIWDSYETPHIPLPQTHLPLHWENTCLVHDRGNTSFSQALSKIGVKEIILGINCQSKSKISAEVPSNILRNSTSKVRAKRALARLSPSTLRQHSSSRHFLLWRKNTELS